MPDTAYQECDDDGDIDLMSFLFPFAERDEDIIAEPRRQRDVPSVPKVGDGYSEMRLSEVLRQLDAE